MSRSIKSKDAQRAHNWNKYTKAYGYEYDYVKSWEIPEDLHTTNQFGSYIAPIVGKRELFKHNRWHILKKTPHYCRKNCVMKDDKRTVNKQHRAEVRQLIGRYVSGKIEDVITTAVGPRNPRHYWS